MLFLTTMVLLGLLVPLLLVMIHDRGPGSWWIAFAVLGLVVTVATLLATETKETGERVGLVMLYLGPLLAQFLGLRGELFHRRKIWIPVLGPFLFLGGFLATLSLVVGLGLLQP